MSNFPFLCRQVGKGPPIIVILIRLISLKRELLLSVYKVELLWTTLADNKVNFKTQIITHTPATDKLKFSH